MKAKILIAEDDANIRLGLVATLESEGFSVVAASDGAQALKLYPQDKYDLVILDVMMPKASGYDVCRELRAKEVRTPILFLTAKGEEIDKVVGLKLGADDYVTKPFGVQELLARVEALLRRSRIAGLPAEGARLPAVFRLGVTEIDREKFTVRAAAAGRVSGTDELPTGVAAGTGTAPSADRDEGVAAPAITQGQVRGVAANATAASVGAVQALTARELKLAEVFAAHAGELLKRDTLLNAVWGVDYFGTTRTLDQHVAQLRRKLDAVVLGASAVIFTVHGVGYRYEP